MVINKYVRKVTHLAAPLSSRLARIDIELTERCNNRCIHCYINQLEDDLHLKEREMNTAFVQSVLKQAADLGCLSVRFTGGEPLLREDFTDLYLYARRLGLKVVIFTNARKISVELARLFARIPPGEPIEVSVYGMRASSYDAVALVRGAYREYWQGVTLLREHNVPFVVKQSLLPQNRSEIKEFETFAAKINNNPYIPGYAMNFDLRTRRDNVVKNRIIKKLRSSPECTLAVLTRDPGRYINEMREFAAKFMRPPGDELFNCGAGMSICIDAYGYVQMCMLLRHPDTVYPLDPEQHRTRNSQTEVLPLEFALTEFFPQIRRLRALNPEYLRRCAVCFLKSLCDQCPAKSWEEHGTLDTPVEYLCQVAHAKAAYLGLISEGEQSWELKPEVWKGRLKTFIGASEC